MDDWGVTPISGNLQIIPEISGLGERREWHRTIFSGWKRESGSLMAQHLRKMGEAPFTWNIDV